MGYPEEYHWLITWAGPRKVSTHAATPLQLPNWFLDACQLVGFIHHRVLGIILGGR